MKVQVVSKDMGARDNGAKVQVTREYSLACPRINLQKECF
jgi:hypothetical protein